MDKSIYEIGDKIFYAESETLVGTVIAINETHWSCDQTTTVMYTVTTPFGRVRRVYEKDIAIKSKKN